MKFDISTFQNSAEKIQGNMHFTLTPTYIFVHISLLKMRHISDKVVEKVKTHFF